MGERVRSPSTGSDISEESSELDISTALLKFNFPKPDSINGSGHSQTLPKSPLEVVSPSHTLFDEVEETSQSQLDDLLLSHSSVRHNAMERKDASPRFGERLNRMDMSSIKRSGALKRALEAKATPKQATTNYKQASAKPKQAKTMPPNMKYVLSESYEEIEGPLARHESTTDRDGELSHSSDSHDSSSDSELGEPLVIASTPSDGRSNIIGIVPAIVIQRPNPPTETNVLEHTEVDTSIGRHTVKSNEQEEGQYDIEQVLDQENHTRRPRSFAMRSRAGVSPRKERTKMVSDSSSEEEGEVAPRVGSLEKGRPRANSGGRMKQSGSSSEGSPLMNKRSTFDSLCHSSKESSPSIHHQAISHPSSTEASPRGKSATTLPTQSSPSEEFFPLLEGKETVAEKSKSLSRESSPQSSPVRSIMSMERRPRSLLQAAPPSPSIIQSSSNKSLCASSESSHISEEAPAIIQRSCRTDLEKSDEQATQLSHEEEPSLDSKLYQNVPESLTRVEDIEANGADSGERSEQSHDSILNPPVMKSAKPVSEEVSQPVVASSNHAKSQSAEGTPDQTPGSPPSANGQERYQWRRRGATRVTQKQKEGSPNEEDKSAMTKQEKARMVASRIQKEGRHMSSSRERHQNDIRQDPSEEMIPYSGSSSLREEEDEEVQQHSLQQRRERARMHAGRVRRREGRLSSSRRRQDNEQGQDHNDL